MDNKDFTQKFIEKTFDNKDEVKDIVNNNVENENIKKGINTALEHEKLTKDLSNFALDNKEEVKNLMEVGEKKSALDLIEFALDNEDFTKKSINKIYENKDDIKDINNKSIKNETCNNLLEHEKLTKFGVNAALKLKPVVKGVVNFIKEEPKLQKDFIQLQKPMEKKCINNYV